MDKIIMIPVTLPKGRDIELEFNIYSEMNGWVN